MKVRKRPILCWSASNPATRRTWPAFVGPAGRILDSALKDAGIAREDTFVTNAVKHFKHERRGKRRLHKRPNNYEIERCKSARRHRRAQPHRQNRDHR